MAVRVCLWVSASIHRTFVAVCGFLSAHAGRSCVSISKHRTSVCVRVCPSEHTECPWLSISTHISTLALPVDWSGDFGPRGLSVQYTKDFRGCPSAHTGRQWVSVSTHMTSVCVCVCPSAHTGRPSLSISTHISTLVLGLSTFVLGLSTLALPVDCLGDFGSRGLSVQYTKDVSGCPPAHTGRPWLSMAVRGCPESSKEKSPQQTISQSSFKYSLNNFDEFVSVQDMPNRRCNEPFKSSQGEADPERCLLQFDVQEFCDNFVEEVVKTLKDVNQTHKKSISTRAPVAEPSLFISKKSKGKSEIHVEELKDFSDSLPIYDEYDEEPIESLFSCEKNCDLPSLEPKFATDIEHAIVELTILQPEHPSSLVFSPQLLEEEPLDLPHQGPCLDSRIFFDEDQDPIFDEDDEHGPVFDEEATKITSIAMESHLCFDADTTPAPLSFELQAHFIDRAQQPEIWRSFVQTGYLGDTSDRGSVKNGYLNIQKVFCHEFNFKGNPTHQGFTEDWNHLKSITEEGTHMMAMEGRLYQYMLSGRWLIKSSGRIMLHDNVPRPVRPDEDSSVPSHKMDLVLLPIRQKDFGLCMSRERPYANPYPFKDFSKLSSKRNLSQWGTDELISSIDVAKTQGSQVPAYVFTTSPLKEMPQQFLPDRYATQALDQFNKHKTMLVKKLRRIVGLQLGARAQSLQTLAIQSPLIRRICNQKRNWKTDETRPTPHKRENLKLGAKQSARKFAGKVTGKFIGDNPAIDLNPAIDSVGPSNPTLHTPSGTEVRGFVYTQDVRVCPSELTRCPWLYVCVRQHTQDIHGCPCVSVSTHRTSVAVRQYTYQHVGPWTQHADPSRALFG
ncbi:hypothetical protein IGI04_042427 [Brassica rapa subsp. trilocularis]|uniref:Uncharacterized protein n=1 Tax=Brassica rapa subsp. trilocularis TaxID=1813537 RepID=A0ABQ7KLB1_BRACM|nr:hypothetical protein IGI04_042427 [Brassica rapa subsp. trilocularis]